MQVEVTELVWFEDHVLTVSELSTLSGLPSALLDELIGCGAIEPIDRAEPHWLFGAAALQNARQAQQLRSAFELDLDGLSLALGLLQRVQALEAQLRVLRARTPGVVR